VAGATLTCYISTIGAFAIDFEIILLKLSVAACAMSFARLRWRALLFLLFLVLLLHFIQHLVDFAFFFVQRPMFLLASATAVYD
jgi:hypothetical protein